MIVCTRFRRYEKNTLRGFADIELTRVGLVIKECCWHESHGKEWIAFPARSYVGPDGETKWQPLVEFAGKNATAAREQFRNQALVAVHDFVAKQEAS
jgi:hypothetical protein